MCWKPKAHCISTACCAARMVAALAAGGTPLTLPVGAPVMAPFAGAEASSCCSFCSFCCACSRASCSLSCHSSTKSATAAAKQAVPGQWERPIAVGSTRFWGELLSLLPPRTQPAGQQAVASGLPACDVREEARGLVAHMGMQAVLHSCRGEGRGQAGAVRLNAQLMPMEIAVGQVGWSSQAARQPELACKGQAGGVDRHAAHVVHLGGGGPAAGSSRQEGQRRWGRAGGARTCWRLQHDLLSAAVRAEQFAQG